MDHGTFITLGHLKSTGIQDVPMRFAKVCSSRTKNNIGELCKMKLELHTQSKLKEFILASY